jgi:hypothetical protein
MRREASVSRPSEIEAMVEAFGNQPDRLGPDAVLKSFSSPGAGVGDPFMDEASIKPSSKHCGVADRRGINCQDITVEDGKIGALPDFEAADSLLLTQRGGRIDGVDGLPQRSP